MANVIGKNIEKRRLALGMTQKDLADKIGYIGRSYVCKIEKGVVEPSIKTLKVIAKILNVDYMELLR